MEKFKLFRTFNGDLAPKSTRFAYSFISTFRDALLQFVSLFLLLYVQFASPLGKENVSTYENMYLIITIGVALIKIISGLLAPFTSFLIEKSNFKMGKYRPFILFGALITSFFYFLMFFTPGEGYLYVALFLLFVFFQEITYQLNDVAFWGYLPSLATDEVKRAKVLSLMNFFIAIGTYTVCAISPLLTTGNAKNNLTIVAIFVGTLYVISQIVFALFFMKEKEVNITTKSNFKLKDSYLPLFKDKQILLLMIAFLLQFTAQFIIIGNSANYFYYNYGYGSFSSTPLEGALLSGGVMSFIFSLVYGVGFTLAMVLYPFLAKKVSKKRMLIVSLIILTIGYLYMFYFGFNKGFEISLFIAGFFTFFFQGIVYIIFTMNCTNIVEYHEYYYKKRIASSVASFKFLSVKFANGIQTILLYIFLLISSLFSLNNSISNAEALFNTHEIDEISKNEMILESILSTPNLSTSLIIYRIGFVILPLILLIIGILITLKFVKILDEKTYENIKNELLKNPNC